MKASPRTELFEYKFYEKYSPKSGLEIYVVGFHNAPTNLPLISVCSFNPPISSKIFLLTSIDFDSPQRSMRCGNEIKQIRGLESTDTSQLIVDIYSVTFENNEPKIVGWGWSILPLFDHSHNGIYLNTGLHMVYFIK